MARKRTISKIESDIAITKAEMTKVQRKYDKLAEKLLVLQNQQKDYENEKILETYTQSGQSFKELMVFLGV